MNKIFAIAFASTLIAASAAEARTDACKVPLPPRRPTIGVPAPAPPPVGAIVTDGMVTARAPVGTDMIVDVDGDDIDVSIEGTAKRGFAKILPWNWSIWH